MMDIRRTGRAAGQEDRMEWKAFAHGDDRGGVASTIVKVAAPDAVHEETVHDLEGKTVLLTGADNPMARELALAFARAGANLAISYHDRDDLAVRIQREVVLEERLCITLMADPKNDRECRRVVEETMRQFGRLDVLVNLANEAHWHTRLRFDNRQEADKALRENFFTLFTITRAALPYMNPGSVIVNAVSGGQDDLYPKLGDFAATYGAIMAYTRALSASLSRRGIRVNGVVPQPRSATGGGIRWPRTEVRASNPFVYLASDESILLNGEVMQVCENAA